VGGRAGGGPGLRACSSTVETVQGRARLALMREGRGLNHPAYAFLSFYRILEVRERRRHLGLARFDYWLARILWSGNQIDRRQKGLSNPQVPG
jgi:Methylamine utilization protein MauJ